MSRISQICDSKESPVDAQGTATESCVQTEPSPMVAMITIASSTLELLESQHHQAAHQLETSKHKEAKTTRQTY